jgi:ketosteroid isomerase-like protein
MAYAYGSYKLTANDPSGKTINDTGKTVEVWRRQNSQRKCVLDTWNTDMPMA